MSDILEIDNDGIEQVSLKQYTEKAYLDYSMYVILDRALPHVGDGQTGAAAYCLRHERAGAEGFRKVQKVRAHRW